MAYGTSISAANHTWTEILTTRYDVGLVIADIQMKVCAVTETVW